jgi:hypothetical protein
VTTAQFNTFVSMLNTIINYLARILNELQNINSWLLGFGPRFNLLFNEVQTTNVLLTEVRDELILSNVHLDAIASVQAAPSITTSVPILLSSPPAMVDVATFLSLSVGDGLLFLGVFLNFLVLVYLAYFMTIRRETN